MPVRSLIELSKLMGTQVATYSASMADLVGAEVKNVIAWFAEASSCRDATWVSVFIASAKEMAKTILEVSLAFFCVHPHRAGAPGFDVSVPAPWPRAEHLFSTGRTEHLFADDISSRQAGHVRDDVLPNELGRRGMSILAKISRPAQCRRAPSWLGSAPKGSCPDPPFLSRQIAIHGTYRMTVEKVFRRKEAHYSIENVRVGGYLRPVRG